MIKWLLTLSFLGLFCVSTFAEVVPIAINDVEIEQAIKELGDDSFSVRDAAHTKLYKLGDRAIPLLKNYVNDKDQERKYRVGILVKKPEYWVSAVEFIQGVRKRLVNSPQEEDLFIVQRSVQGAYDTLNEKLEPLRKQISSALTNHSQSMFYRQGKESEKNRFLKDYISLLAKELPKDLLHSFDGDSITLKVEDRHYRLSCFDTSLGMEVYRLVAINSQNEKIPLKKLLSIPSQLDNGRQIEIKWSNGKAFKSEDTVSFRERVAFNPQDGTRFGDFIQYQVNEGVVVNGDGVGPGVQAAHRFFSNEEIEAAEIYFKSFEAILQ
jgi:hypothetical protein